MAAEARGGTEGSRKELGLVMAQRVAMFGRCMEAKQLHGEPGVSDEEGGENLEERVGLQSPGKSRRACEGEIVIKGPFGSRLSWWGQVSNGNRGPV